MVTLRDLIERFTAWLAKLDETRGKWENPLAKLTGREFYALAGLTTLALVLIMAVAWRSGVNAGQGALPYKAAASTAGVGGTPAYAQNVQSDLTTQSQSAQTPATTAAAGAATQADAGAAARGTSEQASP